MTNLSFCHILSQFSIKLIVISGYKLYCFLSTVYNWKKFLAQLGHALFQEKFSKWERAFVLITTHNVFRDSFLTISWQKNKQNSKNNTSIPDYNVYDYDHFWIFVLVIAFLLIRLLKFDDVFFLWFRVCQFQQLKWYLYLCIPPCAFTRS